MARASALVVLLLLAKPAAAELPPLPLLPFESYPAEARGDLERAYRAASAQSDDAATVAAFARLLHAWEQWEAAHAAYARAQALAPRAFDWHYLDGVVLQRLARHGEAAARLQAALAIAPAYLPARVRRAEALYEAGRLDESRALCEALLLEPAVKPHAHFGLGRVAAAEGRHEAAGAHFEQALALFPEWGAAHYALALSLRALGRREEAQRALASHARHGAVWPGVPDRLLEAVTALRDDADAALRRGQRRAAAGDVNGAIAEYEAALVRDPSLGLAHANLLKLYGQSGDFAKAEAHYHAAVAGGADLADTHYDYGVLQGLQQQWEKAAVAYARALEKDPRHVETLNNLGQIHERRREFEKALEAYRQAVAAQPTHRLARFNLGRMLVALGRPAEAVPEFARLVPPRDADAPRYLFALAVAHVRAGQRAEGLKWANQAKRLAAEYGQHELVAAIERDLASLR
jgi:tetratricopeptide (TPR) repeat protein